MVRWGSCCMLALLVAMTPLASADASSGFETSAHFELSSDLSVVGENAACETPGWDGNFGSCVPLPQGLAGKNWTLKLAAGETPRVLQVCFVVPQSLLVMEGDSVQDAIAALGHGHPAPPPARSCL